MATVPTPRQTPFAPPPRQIEISEQGRSAKQKQGETLTARSHPFAHKSGALTPLFSSAFTTLRPPALAKPVRYWHVEFGPSSSAVDRKSGNFELRLSAVLLLPGRS